MVSGPIKSRRALTDKFLKKFLDLFLEILRKIFALLYINICFILLLIDLSIKLLFVISINYYFVAKYKIQKVILTDKLRNIGAPLHQSQASIFLLESNWFIAASQKVINIGQHLFLVHFNISSPKRQLAIYYCINLFYSFIYSYFNHIITPTNYYYISNIRMYIIRIDWIQKNKCSTVLMIDVHLFEFNNLLLLLFIL